MCHSDRSNSHYTEDDKMHVEYIQTLTLTHMVCCVVRLSWHLKKVNFQTYNNNYSVEIKERTVPLTQFLAFRFEYTLRQDGDQAACASDDPWLDVVHRHECRRFVGNIVSWGEIYTVIHLNLIVQRDNNSLMELVRQGHLPYSTDSVYVITGIKWKTTSREM